MTAVSDRSAGAFVPELRSHHPLGASTGIFAQVRGDWSQLTALAAQTSAYAVELSALSAVELPGLMAFLAASPRLPFRYVSVHAPTKQLADDERSLVRELARVPLWVRAIVSHPDVIVDLGAYRALGSRLVLENMDGRKSSGRTVAELEAVFARLPDAGFCFDVAHAWAVDPSMGLAHELLDRFRSRLRQVHLSSLDDGRHVPLSEQDESRFADVLGRCRDVPWILEALPPARWRGATGALGPAVSHTAVKRAA